MWIVRGVCLESVVPIWTTVFAIHIMGCLLSQQKDDNTDLPLQIHRAKAEKAREQAIKDEMDAKRAKTKAARERKLERVTAKRNALMADEE